MILRSLHRTLYRYGFPSIESHNEVRLQPLTDVHQVCRSFKLTTDPATTVFSYDEVGGTVHHFGLRGPHSHLEIVAEAEVDTHLANPFEGLNLLDNDWGFYASDEAYRRYAEYLSPSPYIAPNQAATALAATVRRKSGKA